MGNKLGRSRQVVDDRYTRPQGLYVHKDVDHKKLRKLILESKLAPCFPGDDESCYDREECPICFLYYPSLNRSRCCMKGICTECFLQMKSPNSARPTQCPFCKTANYAVEYRGVKTKEEKGLEQIEEQRVIEAKIRIRQQELQDEEERMQKKLICSSSTNLTREEIESSSSAAPCHQSPDVNGQISLSQQAYKQPPHSAANRAEELDLDLEDIMVMEAIWLSLQENERQRSLVCDAICSSAQCAVEAHYTSPMMALPAESSSSPSGGLACAIAALAERQQMNGESSISNHNMSTDHMGPVNSSFYNRLGQGTGNYMPTQGSIHLLPSCVMAEARQDTDWCAARGTDAAEAGTSYSSSDAADETTGISALSVPPVGIIPLGTGNDLSRSFGWGGSFPFAWKSAIKRTLHKAITGPICRLDSWQVVVSMPSGEVADPPHSLKPTEEQALEEGLEIEGQLPEKAKCYKGVFYNYFSIGMDAQVAYGFHHLRNEKPYLANGPIANKIIYSGYTCTQGWFLTPCIADPSLRGLKNILRLHIKKVNCSEWELVPVPKSVRAIVALNLHSYGSGRNPWGNPSPEYMEKRGFVEANVDDGLLEIFGLKQGWHASFVMVELISAKHIAQAAAVRLEMRGGEWKDSFLQMDGEPWKQPLSKEYSSFVEIRRVPYQSLMMSGE